MRVWCDIYAGIEICGWLGGGQGRGGEGGRGAGVSTTRRRRPAAYLLTFPRDFLEAKEVHSRLSRHSLMYLLFTLRFAINLSIGTPLCSCASRLLSLSLYLCFISHSLTLFLFLAFSLSLSLILSLFLSLSRNPISIYQTFMHAHTTHNIV